MGHPGEIRFAVLWNCTGHGGLPELYGFFWVFPELLVINSRKEIIPSGYFNKTSEDNEDTGVAS